MSFKGGQQVSERFYELTKAPETYIEKYPLAQGTAVLHMSKCILLEFVSFLAEYLIDGSWEPCYTGMFHISFVNSFIILTIQILIQCAWPWRMSWRIW